jgi:hypothetical protein
MILSLRKNLYQQTKLRFCGNPKDLRSTCIACLILLFTKALEIIFEIFQCPEGSLSAIADIQCTQNTTDIVSDGTFCNM